MDYSNIRYSKAAKVCAYIGIVFGILSLIFSIVILSLSHLHLKENVNIRTVGNILYGFTILPALMGIIFNVIVIVKVKYHDELSVRPFITTLIISIVALIISIVFVIIMNK